MGIGKITSTQNVARFAVFGIKDITTAILNHFDNYPLQSAKKKRFLPLKRMYKFNFK